MAEEYNEEDLKKALRALQDQGMSMAEMARESGIKYGSLTPWLGGTYNGNSQRIAGQVSQWLAARAEREQTVAQIPTAPSYVDTPTARRITTLLTFAQSSPDIVVVATSPGIGKTTASTEYERTHPNVFLITALTSISSAHSLLADIAVALGVTERMTGKLNRAIGAKLKGRRALIVVDDAHKLSANALDELRTLHDLYDCGIALIGQPELLTRLEGKGRDGNLAQLFSRVGMRVTQVRPKPEDVSALASAWGILDPKVMRLVQKIAARPGALRGLTKTLKLASIIAAGEQVNGLSEDAIMSAFKQLGDTLAA